MQIKITLVIFYFYRLNKKKTGVILNLTLRKYENNKQCNLK